MTIEILNQYNHPDFVTDTFFETNWPVIMSLFAHISDDDFFAYSINIVVYCLDYIIENVKLTTIENEGVIEQIQRACALVQHLDGVSEHEKKEFKSFSQYESATKKRRIE